MTRDTVMFAAFSDEMKKIACEMQGFTRIGRKPISIERMLENENEVQGLPEDFAKVAKATSYKTLTLLGAGGALALGGRQAKEDHKVGRLMRKQQQLAAQQAALGA